jgi:hypothetical protein
MLVVMEGFRWLWTDTLSKWRKPDLALALVLLARRNVNPAADITLGSPIAVGREWIPRLRWILHVHKVTRKSNLLATLAGTVATRSSPLHD